MRVAILRRAPKASVSMDVYADALVQGLKTVRPDWSILEFFPTFDTGRSATFLGGFQKYVQRYWAYPRQLRRQSVDVFHVIDHSDGHLIYALKSTGIPTVVTCHDIINLTQPELFKGLANFPWLSKATWQYALRGMCQADRVITVSAYTAQDVTQYLGLAPDRITVVPNGVEKIYQTIPREEAIAFRQQRGIAPETCCLVNVGSNNPRKNIDTILQVVRALRDRHFPIHFWKAGGDFSPAQKQLIQQLALAPHITYLGQPDKATLVKLYNAADILLAPSLYEGFGITVLEAMACGLPVITSNVSSLPEVVGDAAITTDPLDVEAICAAVKQIFAAGGDRQRLIAKGLHRSQQFSWEKTAEQVATLYESLLPLQRSASHRSKTAPTPIA